MDSTLFSKWKAKGWRIPTGAMESEECSTTWNSSSTIRAFWKFYMLNGWYRYARKQHAIRFPKIWQVWSTPKDEISVFMDILITRFYGYIRIYWEISVDILIQNTGETKIDQNSWKCWKKILKNDMRNNNGHFEVFC